MERIVTADFSKFGYKEIDETVRLLNAYMGQTVPYLGDGLSVNFNMHSGNVFLCDEEYNVAMMNGDRLEEWFNCPNCGHEGFLEDIIHEPKDGRCVDYLMEIGV